LSAEIIVIALGTVAQAPFLSQVVVLCIVAVLMTIGVYGIVGAIVKLDDVGLYLSKNKSARFPFPILCRFGLILVLSAPVLMKVLSIVGTAAMFLVGGGILLHGVPALKHALPHGDGFLISLATGALGIAMGLIIGGVALMVVTGVKKLLGKHAH